MSQLPEELLNEVWVFGDRSVDAYEECALHVAAGLSALPEDRLEATRAALIRLLGEYRDEGWPDGALDELEHAARVRWSPPHHVALRDALEVILRELD